MLRSVAEGVKYVSELDPSLQEKIGEPNLEPHGHNVHPLFYLLFRILKLKFVKNVFLGPQFEEALVSSKLTKISFTWLFVLI